MHGHMKVKLSQHVCFSLFLSKVNVSRLFKKQTVCKYSLCHGVN